MKKVLHVFLAFALFFCFPVFGTFVSYANEESGDASGTEGSGFGEPEGDYSPSLPAVEDRAERKDFEAGPNGERSATPPEEGGGGGSSAMGSAAGGSAGIFEGNGITGKKLREGNISFNDIPTMILNATNFFLYFAGTIAVVMIIYGAFKLSLGSVESDKDTAKKIISAALIGFVLAVSAWAIIKIVMTNF